MTLCSAASSCSSLLLRRWNHSRSHKVAERQRATAVGGGHDGTMFDDDVIEARLTLLP